MIYKYRLHGLTVASDIPLAGGSAPSRALPDITIVVSGTAPVSDVVPAGTPLVLVEDEHGHRQAVVKTAQGWIAWFPRVALVHVSSDLSTVRATVDPDGGLEVFGILASGFLVALVLNLRGESVLHASAVQIGSQAWAAVAPSGHGKSTLATLLCRAGARLVTDDVLRVTAAEAKHLGWRGPGATRLRQAAASLAAKGVSDTTADGRISLGLPPATQEHLPLGVIMLPRPDRESQHVRVERVRGSEALMSLIAAPRILGWVSPTHVHRIFMECSALSAAVPIVRVHIPWGPPFGADLGSQIRVAVEEELGFSSESSTP